MITGILNYSISFFFISLFFPYRWKWKHAGCRATTASKVAVWEWIYIYHLVSLGSDKLGEHWAREAVLVLVSCFDDFSQITACCLCCQSSSGCEKPEITFWSAQYWYFSPPPRNKQIFSSKIRFFSSVPLNRLGGFQFTFYCLLPFLSG